MSMQYSGQTAAALPEAASAEDDLAHLDEGQDTTEDSNTPATPEAVAASSGLTAEQVADIVQRVTDGTLTGRLTPLEREIRDNYRAVTQATDKRMSATDKKIAVLEAMVEALLNTADPDALADLKKRREEADFAEQKRELEEQKAALATTTAPPAVRNDDDYHAAYARKEMRLTRLAEKAGVDLPTLAKSPKWPSRLPPASKGDPFGLEAWEETVADLIDAEAERIAKEKAAAPKPRPRTPIDTARGVGGGNADQELVNRAARREPLTAEEHARALAAMERGVFPQLRR